MNSKSKIEIKTCDVCTEKYNKTSRKPVVCSYCQYTICKNCYQINSLHQREVICVNEHCKKPHNYEFFLNNTSSVFVKGDYAQHKKKLLFDSEISKLPETQIYI